MRKVNIFLSYSHKNSRYFDEVRESLQTVEKEFGINLWSDKDIAIGSKWEKEINTALENTDIGVFLISRAFLNSKFIDQVELSKLLARHKKNSAHIFIVILQDCTWDSRSQLKEFHVFNSGVALWGLTKSKRDEALKRLAENILETARVVRESKGKRVTKPSKKTHDRDNGDLPFTNQVSLIKILKPPENVTQSTFTYAAITGLAGQGKSYLLSELKKMYLRKKWVCGYAKFDPEKGDIFFAKELLGDLGVSVKNIRSNKNLGAEFYQQYIGKKKGWKKPLALFIDTLGTATKNDILMLDKNLVEDLDKWITADKYFYNSGKYRLFFAGRNLSGDLIDSQRPENYANLKLSPFRYEDVRDMLNKHKSFSNFSPEIKADLAADMLYLSGGHPGLMSRIVKKYKNEQLSPPDFIEKYIRVYWENDLAVTMNEISHGLFNKKEKIQEFAKKTVAFRYFNKSIIGKLYKGLSPERVVSEIINPSGLYRDDNPDYPNLYSDGTIRDIYALYMLANNPDFIRTKCKKSQSLCWDEIMSSLNAKEFMVEYLFQCLQESIAESKNRIHRQRKLIRRSFEKKIGGFIVKLANMRRDKTRKEEIRREFIGALKNHANVNDGDKNKALFRFWIIYVYKEKSHSIDVYNNFVSTTEKLVNKHFGRRKK